MIVSSYRWLEMYGHDTALIKKLNEKQNGCKAAPGSGAGQMLTLSSSNSYKSMVTLAVKSRASCGVKHCSLEVTLDDS